MTAPDVFLNVPYDTQFEDLFLAYICGLTALGLNPRATIELGGSQRRLERILDLIKQCPYSVHDLSRVELDAEEPHTPRFNMPFELGLAVAVDRVKRGKHGLHVFEAREHRLEKSLSDMNGTDAYIHQGTVGGVFAGLCNAFAHSSRPDVQVIGRVHADLKIELPSIRRRSGGRSVYESRAFSDLKVRVKALLWERARELQAR